MTSRSDRKRWTYEGWRSPWGGLRLSAAVVVLLAAVSVAWGDDDRADLVKQVQADVRELLDANYKGNVEPALRLTHPAIIEELGGRDKAHSTFVEAMGKLKTVGLKIDSFEFPEPPKFVDGERRLYAIIPTRLVVSANDLQLDSRNFQVGVSDPLEKKWTYVEGSKFDARLRGRYFKDFPKDYEFPPVTRLGE